MLDLKSIEALRKLRLQLEESAVLELLLFNDLLTALGALEGQRRYILGKAGMRYVAEWREGRWPSGAGADQPER